MQVGLLDASGVINGDSLFLLKAALMGDVAFLGRDVVRTGYATKSNYADRDKDIWLRYVHGGEYIRRAAAFAVKRKKVDVNEADSWKKTRLGSMIDELINEFCLNIAEEQLKKIFSILYRAAKECGEDKLLTETLMSRIYNISNKT